MEVGSTASRKRRQPSDDTDEAEAEYSHRSKIAAVLNIETDQTVSSRLAAVANSVLAPLFSLLPWNWQQREAPSRKRDKRRALAECDELRNDNCNDLITSADNWETAEVNPFIFMKHLLKTSLSDIELRPIVVPSKTKQTPEFSLVLDLDETLVHASLEPVSDAHITFTVEIGGSPTQIWCKMRPGCIEFLKRMGKLYEIIVFTASQRIYADPLLDFIDPDKSMIHHRLFRDSCVVIEEYYVKELSVLGRDLAKVAIVDNSPYAFGLNIDNGIPISSWFGDQNDSELKKLCEFLEELPNAKDVRTVIRKTFQMQEKIARA